MMKLEDACISVLGEKAARAIIDRQGISWALVAATAAAQTSDDPEALEAISGYLASIKSEPPPDES